MDELVHHCLRELSFDGDLGCSVTRLQDFVNGFHIREDSSHSQTVDDAYCVFVWSIIVQQPGVRVGIIPPGAGGEVYIAPQASAQKKAKTKGEEVTEEPVPPATFDIVPDACIRSLEELRQEYGDDLRIAVDPETTFAAITGSHIRPSKLTPMVYTALQFITRGREQGISVVDLGTKSGYDQKTCYYLIKQLVDLDLIVKRRRPGVSTNFCVHKYFFDNSPVWQQVLKEEAEANETNKRSETQDPEQDAEEEEGQESFSISAVHFNPIDSRHLSSLPLVRARITKLLKSSPHNLHAYQNLLVKIGFATPTRTDRRFFQSRLRQLIQQGVVEKVQVPHANPKKYPDKKVTCLRLLALDEPPEVSEDALPVSNVTAEGFVDDDERLKMNLTVHKQVIDLLDDAGTKGMTLSELCGALDNFDRRTIELLLSRLEKDPPPSHLSDLGIAQLGETKGRERRYVYYTVVHYQTIATREKFEGSRYLGGHCADVGGFLPLDESLFYKDEDELNKYTDDFPFGQDSVGGKAKARAKAKAHKNPILPDGSVKKGKPRKTSVADVDAAVVTKSTKTKRGTKRKRSMEGNEDGASAVAAEAYGGDLEEQPLKRKRGRPPKARPEQFPAGDDGEALDGVLPQEKTPPKKRGRPPKKKPSMDVEMGDEQGASTSVQPTQKKRGRPPKKQLQESSSGAADHAHTEAASVAAPTIHPDQGLSLISMSGHNSEVPMLLVRDAHLPAVESFSPGAAINGGRSAAVFQDAEGATPRRSSRKPKIRSLDDGTPSQQHRPRLSARGSVANVPPPVTFERNADALAFDNEVHTQAGLPQVIVQRRNFATLVAVGEQSESLIGEDSFTAAHHTNVSIITTPGASDIPIDPLLMSNGGRTSETRDATVPVSPPGSLVLLDANATITDEDAGTKRSQYDTPVFEPPAKRVKVDEEGQSGKGRRWKTNISQSRRENEVLQVISDAGGIVNFNSKEFYEGHAALVESITKAGEVASTRPGARLDKRTAQATLEDLESRGKLKSVTTAVPTSTGNLRPVRIIYLPDVSAEDLHTFLSSYSFQHTVPQTVKVLEEPLAYAGGSKRSAWPAAPRPDVTLDHKRHETKDSRLAQQLLQGDDTTVHDGLLTEQNTVAQLYGFVVGKAARACELHLSTIRQFDSDHCSPRVVSADQRIIQTSYYYEELPVSTFCATVSCLINDENLYSLLQTAEGRRTPVGQLSPDLRLSLQLGRWRSRARILDLLDLLRCLGLVVPLQPSTSDKAAVRCASAEGLPDAFDVVPSQAWTLTTAPAYWQFKATAPFHLWGLPDSPPRFWKDAPLHNVTQCIEFWQELQHVCLNAKQAKAIVCPDPSGGPTIEGTSTVAATAKTLRRPSSWTTAYSLSWYQSEYLRQFINKEDASTPLQDAEGGDARLNHISWVTSAPKAAVCLFFEKARTKHLHEYEKTRKRVKKRRVVVKSESTAERKISLAEKAAETKLQRERDWDDMISHVQSDLLNGSAAVRVRRVRARFLQSSGKNRQKWETEIAQTIEDATLAANKLISGKILPSSTSCQIPPVISNGTERSVEDLIAQQGPRLSAPSGRKKKKKSKADEDEEAHELEEHSRRQRFQWNRDYDELARDASAIIKARCRGCKVEWAALEQVFPAVPKNSVRQRCVTLKENPGAEAYLARLEDKWHELWTEHRGTPLLPDPDPGSATNFDLLAHVKFLRNHVDKNALRVGFFELDKDVHTVLPATMEQLESAWEIVDKKGTAPPWDFLWTYVAEEGREKQMAQQAFLVETDEMPAVASYSEDVMHVADSALKMTMGTPNETYDSQIASQLLQSIGEDHVQAATNNLLVRGILSKVIRDPHKCKPGRMLRISESNQNAIGGSISQDVFQDAVALEELLNQDEDAESWRDWPLLATDGDAAALVELVSENRVEFTVDTSQARATRLSIDWNSKKAADDDIETAIRVRLIEASEARRPLLTTGDSRDAQGVAPTEMQPEIADAEGGMEHGQTIDGTHAYCRRSSSEVIDCQACLCESSAALLATFDQQKAEVAQHLLVVLRNASSKGLTKEQLSTAMQSSPRNIVWELVNDVTTAPVPLAHWAGYSSIVLVSSGYVKAWTVVVKLPERTSKMIFPRRWIDIAGRRMGDAWSAALRAAVGVILHRPGISQSEIYWRLRSVYDRHEVNDVLQCLLNEGLAKKQPGSIGYPFVGPPDDQESRAIFWLPGDVKHWYQL